MIIKRNILKYLKIWVNAEKNDISANKCHLVELFMFYNLRIKTKFQDSHFLIFLEG
jgi:hypothetical protein